MLLNEINKYNIQNYDITYNDAYHSYYHTVLNKKLISVTQLLAKFKKPFPKEFMAAREARQCGLHKEDVLKMWEESGIIGSKTGTIVHNYLENAVKNKFMILRDETNNHLSEIINKRLSFIQWEIKAFLKDYDFNKTVLPIAQECVLGNDLYAGQLDFFGYSNTLNKFIILDYKTDKELTTESKYKLLKPLSHLQDTKINKYSLQVSMYQYCIMNILNLSENDIERKIIWFNENNDNYKEIEVPYLKEEVNTILKTLQ